MPDPPQLHVRLNIILGPALAFRVYTPRVLSVAPPLSAWQLLPAPFSRRPSIAGPLQYTENYLRRAAPRAKAVSQVSKRKKRRSGTIGEQLRALRGTIVHQEARMGQRLPSRPERLEAELARCDAARRKLRQALDDEGIKRRDAEARAETAYGNGHREGREKALENTRAQIQTVTRQADQVRRERDVLARRVLELEAQLHDRADGQGTSEWWKPAVALTGHIKVLRHDEPPNRYVGTCIALEEYRGKRAGGDSHPPTQDILRFKRGQSGTVEEWLDQIQRTVRTGTVLVPMPGSREGSPSVADPLATLVRAAARTGRVNGTGALTRGTAVEKSATGGERTVRKHRETMRGTTDAALRRKIAGADVVVVDDVVTSGATMVAAIEILLTMGAARVQGLALGMTRRWV